MAAHVPCVPLVNHIDSAPELVSRHRMSTLPSPLKSPTPCTTKLLVTVPSPLELVTWPFCTPHSAMSPALSRHRMSPLASPTMVQVMGSAPKTAVEATVAPFMNQTATVPVLLSRHKRSPLPSPLRSAVPKSVQLLVKLPTAAAEPTVAPFMNHIETLPLLSRQRMSALP